MPKPAGAQFRGQAHEFRSFNDVQLARGVQQRLRVVPGPDRQLLVLWQGQRRDAQPRQAALDETQDVAFAAEREVTFGQFEAVT